MAMTATQRTMVTDNAGLAELLMKFVIKHSVSAGNHTLTANGFWEDAFGSTTKPATVNGATKAEFLAAVKAGVDAIQ